jgi:hypothetical protein
MEMLIHAITGLLAMLQATSTAQAPAAPPPPAAPRPCQGEAHAAFDFWVGEWDVYPAGADKKIADSRIERVASGCAIRESWLPLTGGGGTSITLRNHRHDRWEQVWIGGDGKRVDFTGGMVDGAMVLTGYWDGVGPAGEDQLIRMTYTPRSDGSVRQFGEASTDHGKTWQTSFDFIYRPKKETP